MENSVAETPKRRPSLLGFCGRSLFREYGRAFFTQVICRHPRATLHGLNQYVQGRSAVELPPSAPSWLGGPGSLVGVGFCLKPLSPACPAGRANHRCTYFDHTKSRGQLAPAACRECRIREFGEWAWSMRSDFYVMTSAQDILRDVLLPALSQRRYGRALLVLCRYSFEPMRLALAIAEIETHLIPLAQGDCRDYSTWRRADLGDKAEQTELMPGHRPWLAPGLPGTRGTPANPHFERSGEIYQIKAGQ